MLLGCLRNRVKSPSLMMKRQEGSRLGADAMWQVWHGMCEPACVTSARARSISEV